MTNELTVFQLREIERMEEYQKPKRNAVGHAKMWNEIELWIIRVCAVIVIFYVLSRGAL
jgi:hypothetical protein